MRVPFNNLRAPYESLRPELDAAWHRVMDSGWYLFGAEVADFEREFAAWCRAGQCVGVGNGLDALHLALRACGIGPGDEVIVPANTYIATWLAVSMAGARVVPVEPDERTRNIDPGRIEGAVTASSRAILPVHLFGMPTDMEAIADVARQHGLEVIDDAAQAHGARWRGRNIGTFGTATAWSFYPTKNLGAFGDAGAVTSDRPELITQIRTLANYGSREKYKNEERGVNSRLDALHAALLRVKLARLDGWQARRTQIAARYLEELRDITWLELPYVPEGATPAWHLFVVRTEQRDRLQAHLRECGIETLVHYPQPPHLSKAYADHGWGAGAFPITEAIARTCLSLPLHPYLVEDQISAVIDAVRSFAE